MPPSSERSVEEVNDPAQWVERYGDLLFAYAVARVASREVAEDLVQDTFLAALDARGRFTGKSSRETWLIGILRHKIVDYYRRKSRPRPTGEPLDYGRREDFDERGHWRDSPARWPRDPARSLEETEFWAVFETCLGKLPPLLAQAFCLRELESLSTEEMCKILDVSTTNLNVRIYRARMSLRNCLERNWFAPSSD